MFWLSQRPGIQPETTTVYYWPRTPPGYAVVDIARPSRRGGGVAIIFRQNCIYLFRQRFCSRLTALWHLMYSVLYYYYYYCWVLYLHYMFLLFISRACTSRPRNTNLVQAIIISSSFAMLEQARHIIMSHLDKI